MPRDIEVEGEDIVVDATNDLGLVDGFENTRQSIALNTRDATHDFLGSQLTPSSVNRLRGQIRDVLDDDPQVERVVEVVIAEVDKQSNNVTIEVKLVDDEDFTQTLP